MRFLRLRRRLPGWRWRAWNVYVMNSDCDARPPRELTPAFFGCYGWQSIYPAWGVRHALAWLMQLAQELRTCVCAGNPAEAGACRRLKLSRVWMPEGIATGMPPDHKRRPRVLERARQQGGHWLASFAVYLVTGRGVAAAR